MPEKKINLYVIKPIVWRSSKIDAKVSYAKSPDSYTICDYGCDGCTLTTGFGTTLYVGTLGRCKAFAEKHKRNELKRFLLEVKA